MDNDKAIDGVGLRKQSHVAHEVEGVASGMVVGALLGVAGGPPGVIAGAVIGGLAGAITAAGIDMASERGAARTKELDSELGIDEGELGAPNLRHPPAPRGTLSSTSAGAVDHSEAPAEGPMQ